jgi:hypothetical protein
MRRVVYVLLVMHIVDNEIKAGVGPVCWSALDASQAARSLTMPGTHVQIVEREVRGEMPQMRTSAAD